MANMGYCCWENTSNDLRDCCYALQEIEDFQDWFSDLEETEQRGVEEVLRIARKIVQDLGSRLE